MRQYLFSLFALGLLFLPQAHALLNVYNGFSDLSGPYSKAIDSIAKQNIVQGYSDGTFKPNNLINRAEFTKIVIEAKYPGQATGTGCFNDVQAEWFAPYVCFAKGKAIINGNPDGTFRAGSNINVAEAYKIISETFLVSPKYDPTGNWYEKYLEYARYMNVGYNKRLDPNHQLTRGEMAQTIYNYLEHIAIGAQQQALLETVNHVRTQQGSGALSYNKILEKVAYDHAVDMHKRNYFEHISPDGVNPEKRMEPYYLPRDWKIYEVGENLWQWSGVISSDPAELAQLAMYGSTVDGQTWKGWMNSPQHKANILHPNFTEIGIGYYQAPNGTVYFVQNFGGMEF